MGGTSGIGFGVAKAALAEGASVVVCSSKESKVINALERLVGGERAAGEILDVSDEAAVKAFFEKTGKFDHLVYTAGDRIVTGFPKLELSGFKAAFDVRLWGALLCAQHARHYVTDSFTITSGTGAYHPHPGWAITASVTGALISAARNLALDLAPVRVNCVVPGAVDTELWEHLPEDVRQSQINDIISKQPVKHIGTPEEVADVYMLAMKCTYLTGQDIIVDGGRSLA